MFKRFVPVLLVVCASLTVGAPANALVVHELVGTFGQVADPNDIIFSDAVDNSGGPSNEDVYVAHFDETESAVEKFDRDGTPTGVKITGAGTPQGSFSFFSFTSFYTSGIAVDSSSGINKGDVYVADIEHNVVDKFDETGHYVCQITGTSTPSPSECNGPTGSDTPNGSMDPTGVAVNDASDDLYVSDPAHGVIDEFGPAGEYIGQIVDSSITVPGALAFDSNGNLYVANAQRFHGVVNVVKLNPKGEFVSVFDSNPPLGVAVDSNPASDHVYVNEVSPQDQIAEYDSAGNLLTDFGPGPETTILAEAVNNTTGNIYAAGQNNVYIFTPPRVVPGVRTNAATNVQSSTATLNGEVEPDVTNKGGEITSCQFEYGTSTAYGQTVSCSPATPYASTTSVSANVNLTPSTEYHYRVVAADSGGTSQGGTNHGEDKTLITSGPASIDSESSSDAVISSATVNARIDPFGFDTTCEMQYVNDAAFQATGYANATTLPCGPQDLGSGFSDQSTSVKLNGLQIDTTYHYRFIATSSAGTSDGADQTFATFGIKSFSLSALDQGLQPYTQAAGHPYQLTTTFAFNTTSTPGGKPDPTDANPKDIHVELPPGLIGNPEATPKCPPYDVAHADCSGADQVGLLTVYTPGNKTEAGIYNLVPPRGMAAQFGARFNGFVTAHINAKIRTGGDYGVTADSLYISDAEGLTGVKVTFWGVPADPSHDSERYCPVPNDVNESPRECFEHAGLVPFLTNPTSCSGRLSSRTAVDSWQDPGVFVSASSEMPGMTGCDEPDFSPTIKIQPDNNNASSPTGLKVDLHVPQNNNPDELAEANLENAVVTLPEGMTVNPSSANGLGACAPGQIELHGPEPANCPDASKIGTVQIKTPLLDHPLTGSLYLATPYENPFNSLLAIYIAVYDPISGVVVKLPGRVETNPITGELSTRFDQNPQLPFEDLKVELFGGPRASLKTPDSCGLFTASTDMTPWTSPEGADATPSSTFTIDQSCGTHGFAPSFTAGTSNNQAGAYSLFTMTLSRSDQDQAFGGVTLQTPPGLLGALKTVPLCGEPQAAQGTCSSVSQIGHTTVGAGVGNEPVFLPQSGRQEDPVYLTGPYDGAPFGLSIVEHAEAGPFNLGPEDGKPIIVRAAINVDPHTAQITVTSNELPHILQGIPLQVRTINVVIDRTGFIFNPTNCSPLSVGGTITSTQNTTTGVSSPFDAANCTALPFKPGFAASTAGKTSKANGASLTVKVTSKGGPQTGGGEANIAKVRVTLPKQLPARLTTLQKACTEAQFNTNPAGCPPASLVGTATAITPVLANPVSGPAYLVSHGGAAFPDLVFILQGEGITLYLDGNTNIKQGITTSTFNSVPDAPISSFVTTFPQGPHSVLATDIPVKAKNSMCAQKLTMPTTLTAQNGAVIAQTTKIGVTGCPKAKKKAKTKTKKAKHTKKGPKKK